MSLATRVKLSAMMFLQYLMMPVWFLALGKYMVGLDGSGPWMFWTFNTMAFGTMASPVVCMFADKFLNSERMLLICNAVSGAALFAAAQTMHPGVLFTLLLIAMLFYMPTWSLTAAIAMSNSTTAAFPQIRVFGSMGWAAAAVFGLAAKYLFDTPNFEATPAIFLCGGSVSLAGAVLALFLPATPPRGRDKPLSVTDALGLRSLVLMRNPAFAIFTCLFFLSMIPFQWYNSWTVPYLSQKGFELGVSMMSWGQGAEICFMLLVPVILRKAGYKWAMVMGLAMLSLRYGAFFAGSSLAGWPGETCDMLGILLHGLIFGLLIVGAQMYVDEVAPADIRNQAQGFVMLVSGGLGVLASNFLFGRIVPLERADLQLFGRGYLVAFALALAITLMMAVLFRPGERRAQRQTP